MRNPEEHRDWWNKRRLKYNVTLFLSGFLAFMFYSFLLEVLTPPEGHYFEITAISAGFQFIGFLLAVLTANFFYLIGAIIEYEVNKKGDLKLRKKLYDIGFWFSFALPFLIPILFFISNFQN
ncbi:MAG: hypothetical protein KDC84_12065 [Crocinitomicaceae bacterium]|nr:hypothetical protein [Crocinitomicaceae bacterium]